MRIYAIALFLASLSFAQTNAIQLCDQQATRHCVTIRVPSILSVSRACTLGVDGLGTCGILSTYAHATLPTPVNGLQVYCSDCHQDSTCTASGSGAVASVVAGAYYCGFTGTTYLPLTGGTMSGNILSSSASTLGDLTHPFGTIWVGNGSSIQPNLTGSATLGTSSYVWNKLWTINADAAGAVVVNSALSGSTNLTSTQWTPTTDAYVSLGDGAHRFNDARFATAHIGTATIGAGSATGLVINPGTSYAVDTGASGGNVWLPNYDAQVVLGSASHQLSWVYTNGLTANYLVVTSSITSGGHYISTGTIPTLSGTGTCTISTGSTDAKGIINCTAGSFKYITFATSYSSTPSCIVTGTQNGVGMASVSTTNLLVSFGSTLPVDIHYHCMQ